MDNPRTERLTLKQVNEQNHQFWAQHAPEFADLMSDKELMQDALEEFNREILRHPLRSCRPLEQVVLDIRVPRRIHKRIFHSDFSSKGGRAKKADQLSTLIESMVTRDPDLSERELLARLRSGTGLDFIAEVNDDQIVFRTGKTAEISGLKDRLSRAKKQISLNSQKRLPRI